MIQLKLGDHVRAYSAGTKFTGVVSRLDGDMVNILVAKTAHGTGQLNFHRKQVRKLKPKPALCVWWLSVDSEIINGKRMTQIRIDQPPVFDAIHWIMVREVPEPKTKAIPPRFNPQPFLANEIKNSPGGAGAPGSPGDRSERFP